MVERGLERSPGTQSVFHELILPVSNDVSGPCFVPLGMVLQGPVGNSQPFCGARLAPDSFLTFQSGLDGSVLGNLFDLLKSHAQGNGQADGTYEGAVTPVIRLEFFSRSIFLGNVACGYRALPRMAITEARHHLLEVANIPGVFALQEIFTHRLIHSGLVFVIAELPEEMISKWQNIFGTLPEWRKTAGPAGDAIVEISSKPPPRLLLLQIFVGCAHEAEIGLLPDITSHTLIRMLLHNPQQFSLESQRKISDFIEE